MYGLEVCNIRWAGQLSTTRATFLPSRSNFRSCSLTQSSKSWLSIQLLFCARYLQGRFRTPLKYLGFFDLPITNMGSFSPVALAAASPVRRTLLYISLRHNLQISDASTCLVRLCKIGQTHQRWICHEGRNLREALERWILSKKLSSLRCTTALRPQLP